MDKLLSESIYNAVFADRSESEVTELRMRAGKPLSFAVKGEYLTADGVIVTYDDIEHTIGMASKHSVYAVNDSIAKGYIVCGEGYRIGLCGEGVMKDGRLFTLKNITSLCLRVPHEIKGCCESIAGIFENLDNTLIISPPGLGKTTMLREAARLVSQLRNVLVLDERGELIPVDGGRICVETGQMCDVASNIPKLIAYETLVRTMRPDVIVTDEVFGEREVRAICDISRCGVKVFASLHAEKLEQVFASEIYRPLCGIMRYFVTIEAVGKVGKLYDKGSGGCLNW